ncbi:putative RNA-associated protein [Reticulomyxa filosa]|uniref:Putative RNA-associated protein n=1 Tax=Reticulomyxa filosa TaxID=46433 RepID=X6P1U1_RETFI|nr:putative RNA-associated protein [Reticulomyxa filosa]|eukprot:ETO32034.1 putative RNA-associated protein [Reticulomyxa filosa]
MSQATTTKRTKQFIETGYTGAIDENPEVRVCRFKTKQKQRLEILVNPHAALAFQRGEKSLNISDIVAKEEIYLDVHKGELASHAMWSSILGEENKKNAIRIILEKGEIHLTPQDRKMLHKNDGKQVKRLIEDGGRK